MDTRALPKRSLGQNFLQDPNIIRKILGVIEAGESENIVEIGPGRGALTEGLIASGCRLTCIELDDDLADFWKGEFRGSDRRQLLHADALKADLNRILPVDKLVGNIPYNISSPLLRKVFSYHKEISQVVFMVQKEFAEKCAAGPGSRDYGINAVLTALFSRVEIFFHVPPGAFYPRPGVMSAVIGFEMRNTTTDFKTALTLVSAAFGQRRKKLRNSLSEYFCSQLQDLPLWDKRADALSPKEYEDLIGKIQEIKKAR